jgi:hypothetical protein
MSSEARTLSKDNGWELADWCGGNLVAEHDALDDSKVSPGINVPVGDDVQRASMGDTIIRKNDGTFEIFKNKN